jgi:hypothetical protein
MDSGQAFLIVVVATVAFVAFVVLFLRHAKRVNRGKYPKATPGRFIEIRRKSK